MVGLRSTPPGSLLAALRRRFATPRGIKVQTAAKERGRGVLPQPTGYIERNAAERIDELQKQTKLDPDDFRQVGGGAA